MKTALTFKKWFIFIELSIAFFLVFAYNVLEIIPLSETPFIFLIVLISFWLHKQGWRSIGFKRPASWGKTVLIACWLD